MALTKEMTYNENEIKHRFGPEYYIPVTLTIMDGATEKFSVTIQVEHNINNTIDSSINHQQTKDAFQKAISERFKNVADIKAKSTEITESLGTLKESLSLEAAKK